jgi:hypothetical protein
MWEGSCVLSGRIRGLDMMFLNRCSSPCSCCNTDQTQLVTTFKSYRRMQCALPQPCSRCTCMCCWSQLSRLSALCRHHHIHMECCISLASSDVKSLIGCRKLVTFLDGRLTDLMLCQDSILLMQLNVWPTQSRKTVSQDHGEEQSCECANHCSHCDWMTLGSSRS